MVHGLLNVVTSKSYIPYQMLENKQMLYQFLTEPNDFLKHIRRYSNAGLRVNRYPVDHLKLFVPRTQRPEEEARELTIINCRQADIYKEFRREEEELRREGLLGYGAPPRGAPEKPAKRIA